MKKTDLSKKESWSQKKYFLSSKMTWNSIDLIEVDVKMRERIRTMIPWSRFESERPPYDYELRA